jgi:hypothetical protein
MFLLHREQVTPILQTVGKLTFNIKWLHIALRYQALFLTAVMFCETCSISTTFMTLPFSQIPNGKSLHIVDITQNHCHNLYAVTKYRNLLTLRSVII